MGMLYDFGITDEDFNDMVEACPMIKDFDEEDARKNIEILKRIGCLDSHIHNILFSNPDYLIKDFDDIVSLINKFNEFGFTSLYLLFDSNPFLFDIEVWEFEKFVEEKKSIGVSAREIMDMIEGDPYIF